MVDRAIRIASLPGVIFTSYGDMLRVPGSESDLFQAKERAKAIAIYYMSTPFGSGIGMTVGAILVHYYGWRNTLYLAGAPGPFSIGVRTALPHSVQLPS